MLKRIALWTVGVVVVILSILVVTIAMQPSEFTVTRAAKFNAPPEKLFAQVNDFHKWSAWSPWAKLDPNMKVSFAGASAGAGATYRWLGNDEVGEGLMTIREIRPNESIEIDLSFKKPFQSNNVTEFLFRPDGNGTSVTWTMTGQKNFITKAFCMVMNMDKMVGGDFEKGLSNLRTVVESQ